MGASKLQAAMEEMSTTISENERLKADVEQKDRLITELKERDKMRQEEIKEFEPYLDIIREAPKNNYLLKIGDEKLFKRLKLLAAKTIRDGDHGAKFVMFTERVLDAATSFCWPSIKSNQFKGMKDE